MKVLYEDNHIVIVVKPPGIPTMPDISADESMLDIVKAYIKEKHLKPGNVYIGLVHRLDRLTGGVMVFARTSKGASRISEQIRQKKFKKTYLAVVDGFMKDKSGQLCDYLQKNTKTNRSDVVSFGTQGAKEAVLEYSVRVEKSGCSLLEINMKTGRHHQIRAQFANAGYPLRGDTKYGSRYKGGQALWAYKLEFKHPVKNEIIEAISEPDYSTEPWSLFK